jgi:hypothetical protein
MACFIGQNRVLTHPAYPRELPKNPHNDVAWRP